MNNNSSSENFTVILKCVLEKEYCPPEPECNADWCCCCCQYADSVESVKTRGSAETSGKCSRDQLSCSPSEEEHCNNRSRCSVVCSNCSVNPPADIAQCDSGSVTINICNVISRDDTSDQQSSESNSQCKQCEAKQKDEIKSTPLKESNVPQAKKCGYGANKTDKLDSAPINESKVSEVRKCGCEANKTDKLDSTPINEAKVSEVRKCGCDKKVNMDSTPNKTSDSPVVNKCGYSLQANQTGKLDWSRIKESNVPLVWLLGKPGTGKDTQAQIVSSSFPGFIHISTGELLRNEVLANSSRSYTIEAVMKQGGLVSNDIVNELLNKKMLADLPNAKAFLIDGYPRDKEQADQFVKDTKPPKKILYLDAPDKVIICRLKWRGFVSGRQDDNEETIKKRLNESNANDALILEAYRDQIIKIDTDRAPKAVFLDVKEALKDIHPHVQFSV